MTLRELLDSGRRIGDLTVDELFSLNVTAWENDKSGFVFAALQREIVRRMEFGDGQKCAPPGQLPLAQR
jgi:hypothetical protein